MEKREVTIEKGVDQHNVVGWLLISPETCPLNPGGEEDAPNPSCYELHIENYEASLCCFWEGCIEENKTIFTRCLYSPDIPYERHEYKLTEVDTD